MKDLIPVFQAAQDGNGILHRRFIHQHRLKPPLQRCVLFDIHPVLIQGSGADTMKFASCQHWFQHIAGIHGALRLTGAHDSMKLIYK